MPDEPILRPYAASLKLKARAPLPVAAWEQAASEFFNALVAGCREKGTVVIGHIKGFLDLGPSGYPYLSTVGTSTGTSSAGRLRGPRSPVAWISTCWSMAWMQAKSLREPLWT